MLVPSISDCRTQKAHIEHKCSAGLSASKNRSKKCGAPADVLPDLARIRPTLDMPVIVCLSERSGFMSLHMFERRLRLEEYVSLGSIACWRTRHRRSKKSLNTNLRPKNMECPKSENLRNRSYTQTRVPRGAPALQNCFKIFPNGAPEIQTLTRTRTALIPAAGTTPRLPLLTSWWQQARKPSILPGMLRNRADHEFGAGCSFHASIRTGQSRCCEPVWED